MVPAHSLREDRKTEASRQFAALSSGQKGKAGRGDRGISETVGTELTVCPLTETRKRLKRPEAVSFHLNPTSHCREPRPLPSLGDNHPYSSVLLFPPSGQLTCER